LTSVSVLITNYNHDLFLEQRINSVLNQTYQDFEVVILDDCSTDNSAFIINSYATHPKVSKVLVSETNTGNPFKQWIASLPYLKGDFIWIAESDDFADLRFLEICMSYIRKYQCLFVHTDSYIVDEYDNIKERYSDKKNAYFKTDFWKHNQFSNSSNTMNTYFLFENIVNNVSSAVFHRSFLSSSDKRELTKFRNVGDYYFFLDIVYQTSYSYISEPLNYFRFHQNNFTKKNYETGRLGFEVLHMLSDYINKIKISNPTFLISSFRHYEYLILKHGKSYFQVSWKRTLKFMWFAIKQKHLNVFDALTITVFLFWDKKQFRGLDVMSRVVYRKFTNHTTYPFNT